MTRKCYVRGVASAVAASGLAACATNHIVVTQPLSESAIAQINEAVVGGSGTVVLRTAAEPTAVGHAVEPMTELKVGVTTSEWRPAADSDASSTRSVPTAALRRITVRNPKAGAAAGALIGVGAGLVGSAFGAAAGALLANACFSEPCPQNSTLAVMAGGAALGFLVVGLPSILLGAAIGGATGQPTQIDFVDSATDTAVATVPGARAAPPGEDLDELARPRANTSRPWFLGLGGAVLGDLYGGSQGGGPGLTLDAAYEEVHWGVRLSALVALTGQRYKQSSEQSVFVIATYVPSDAASAAYFGGGAGWLRETGGFYGATEPGQGLAAVGEIGWLYQRNDSWGRLALGLRFVLPLFGEQSATPAGTGGSPSFPFLAIFIRFML